MTENELIRFSFSLPTHFDLVSDTVDGHLPTEQILLITRGNLQQDANQFNSALHFDNCAFPEGRSHYLACWEEIGSQIASGHKKEALITFGKILHSVQDFYAHSNWVELHLGENPIPVWDLNLDSLPGDIVSGTYLSGFPKKCKSNAPSHESLNKDSQDSETGRIIIEQGHHHGKSLFQLAYDVALHHSRKEFTKFLNVFTVQQPESIISLSNTLTNQIH